MHRTSFSLIIFMSLLVATSKANLPAYGSPDDFTSYLIKGDSMQPTVEPDDWITVKTDITAFQMRAAPQPDGDTIVFYMPKTNASDDDLIVAHRAIESLINNDTGIAFFRTRGDNRANRDSWPSDYRGENYSWNGMVSEKLLIGKVVGINKPSQAGSWNGVAYNVTVYTNSTVTEPSFSQSDKKIQFDITGYASHSSGGFCNVTIPKAILNCSSLTDWQVKLNGTSLAYTANEDETHTFIYFVYSYSAHHIQIIGTRVIAGQQTDFSSQWTIIATAGTIAAVLAISAAYFIKRKKPTQERETT